MHLSLILQLCCYKFSFEDLIEDLIWILNPSQMDLGLRILNQLRNDLDFWIFWIGLRIFSKLCCLNPFLRSCSYVFTNTSWSLRMICMNLTMERCTYTVSRYISTVIFDNGVGRTLYMCLLDANKGIG